MTFPVALRPPAVDRRAASRLAGVAGSVAMAVVVWCGYDLHWTWTGLTSNATLWAWMKLLALPLSLTALPLWLSSHQRMTAARRIVLTTATVALAVLVVAGYALDWRWTGFAGNTLWDWLEVLLLPATIATVKYWTTERTIRARHRLVAAAVVVGFVVFAVSAYVMPIGWSGFTGNTLWDWVRLLFVPLLMPLVLAPVVTDWMLAGTEAGTAEPTELAAYDVWVTPDHKVTARIVQPSEEGAAPQLRGAAAHAVALVTAD